MVSPLENSLARHRELGVSRSGSIHACTVRVERMEAETGLAHASPGTRLATSNGSGSQFTAERLPAIQNPCPTASTGGSTTSAHVPGPAGSTAV